jgi:hypothetical protein
MDLNRLKKLYEEAKSRAGGGNNRIWKPKPGLNTVRPVPYIHDPDLPFLELRFHYEVSKRPVLSPSSPCIGKPDPILEFALKLQSEAGGDKDLWVQGKRLEPKSRYFLPVLVRGSEHEGVKFWGFGVTIFEDLFAKITNPKWGDFTDLMDGRDIDITYEKPNPKNRFGKTIIDVSPERSPATTDERVLNLLKEMPQIESLFTVPTYEELERMLAEYIAKGMDDTDESDNFDDVEEPDDFDEPDVKPSGKSLNDLFGNNSKSASTEASVGDGSNDPNREKLKKAFGDIFNK